MYIIDNDLLSIQEARILAEDAHRAQQDLALYTQERLDNIVEAIADAVLPHAEELAVLSADETDFGNWKDKYAKNHFVCTYLREQLRGRRCVGVMKDDPGKGLVDIGVPMGVIAALCPATSPVSTTIYKSLIAVKSGNAIVFSPHPRAKETIGKALDIIIEAAEAAGLPEGAISYMHTVTASGTIELMNHEQTAMILNTGVPGMLKAAQDSNKPLIYGGAGNGPVFIERTADIKQAVGDIIASKTFDYGVVSGAEHSVVVDAPVEEEARTAFRRHGAYFMSEDEAAALGVCLVGPDGEINPEFVGISAERLAARAGFQVPQGTCLLIAEGRYNLKNDPYAGEKLCPVLSWYIEDDWQDACEKCIELLFQKNDGHTLVIHSKDEYVIRQFALKKPVARVLVNTPATLGGMGVTTNLFPSMTLGSGMAGRGITSDNVGPMNLVYIRTVGRGVRSADSLACPDALQESPDSKPREPSPAFIEAARMIAELLDQ